MAPNYFFFFYLQNFTLGSNLKIIYYTHIKFKNMFNKNFSLKIFFIFKKYVGESGLKRDS